MTGFNSIWTSSINQAMLLLNSGAGAVSGGGPLSTPGGNRSASTGPVNTATGLLEPLDILLGQVSGSVSSLMSAFSLTRNMNFSQSFRSAFSLSPFQRTATALNNTLAAASITQLARGVFNQATSAAQMTSRQQEEVMTTLLSGVNLGFMSAGQVMQANGIMTSLIQQSLDSLQNNVQTNMGMYYDSIFATSADDTTSPASVFATSGTPTGAVVPTSTGTIGTSSTSGIGTTGSTVGTVAPASAGTSSTASVGTTAATAIDSPTTVGTGSTAAIDSATPIGIGSTSGLDATADVTDGTETTSVGTGSPTSTTSASSPTASTGVSATMTTALNGPLQSVLTDPAVRQLLNDVEKQVFTFGSGPFLAALGNSSYSVAARNLHTDSHGVAHEIIGVSNTPNSDQYWSPPADFYVVDGNSAFQTIEEANNYIDSNGTFTFKDGAGNTHTLEGTYSSSQYEYVPFSDVKLDGVAVTDNQLYQWAANNGLEHEVDSYGQQTYFVGIETPYGTQKRALTQEGWNGNASTIFGNDGSWSYTRGEVFIKSGDGSAHSFSSSDYTYDYNYRVDGQSLSPQEMAQWADSNGLQKVSISDNGNTVDAYYADVITANGSTKAHITTVINGTAYNYSTGADFKDKIISPNGDNHYISRNTSYDYQTSSYSGVWYTVDGMAVQNTDAANMVKNATNLTKDSFVVNGTQYDRYTAQNINPDYANNSYVIDTSTGELTADRITSTNIQIGSSTITRTEFSYAGYTTINQYIVNGTSMSINELGNWLEQNVTPTLQGTASNGDTYNIYTANGNEAFAVNTSANETTLINGDTRRTNFQINGATIENVAFSNIHGLNVEAYRINGTYISQSNLRDWLDQNATPIAQGSTSSGETYNIYADANGNETFAVNTNTNSMIRITGSYSRSVFQSNGNTIDNIGFYNSQGRYFEAFKLNGTYTNSNDLRDWVVQNNSPTFQMTASNGESYNVYTSNRNLGIAVNTNTNEMSRISNISRTAIQFNGSSVEVARFYNNQGFPVEGYKINGANVNQSNMIDWLSQNSAPTFQYTDNFGETYNIYATNGNEALAISTSANTITSFNTASTINYHVNGNTIENIVFSNNNGLNINAYKINGSYMSPTNVRDWSIQNGVNTNQWTSSNTGRIFKEYLDDTGNVYMADDNTGRILNREDYYAYRTYSPIALDMGGDGIQTVSAEQGVKFDLLGNRQPVRTGWVGGGNDALLAMDRNNNGAIDSGMELFGNQHGAANGYAELAKFDDNNDGIIDSRDAVYGKLKLWNDANMNGVSDRGELRGLAESGVASISTGFQNSNFVDAAGNEHRQVSSFTKSNGQTGLSTDLWFRYNGITSYLNNPYIPR